MKAPRRRRTTTELLAADFPPVTYEAWRRRVEEEAGGTPFAETLDDTSAGLTRKPLYTERDAAGDDPAGFPGLPPFVRGKHALGRGWTVAQEYRRSEDAGALEADVAAGVEAVWIHAGSFSPEPFLARLDLARTAVVVAGRDDAAALLAAEATRQGIAREELRGGLGCDPLGAAALRGASAESFDRSFERAAGLAARCRREMPGVRALLIDLEPYRGAGARAVDELAYLAASTAEVLRRLAGRGVDAIARQTTIAVAVGSDFFPEVAKLRAARLLWAKVVRACGGSPEAQAAYLHARTSAVDGGDGDDPWDDVLRGTVETFAAVVGGADSIAIAPYDDAALGLAELTGRRLAVNTQHVLREEAFLDRVIDPAGGSYCVERLTDDLARAAWSLFQEIEERGGMAHCLEDGWIRDRFAAAAGKPQEEPDH